MKKNFTKVTASGESKLAGLAGFFFFLCSPPGIALAFRLLRKKLIAKGIIKVPKIRYEQWLNDQVQADLESYKKLNANGAKLPFLTIVIVSSGDFESLSRTLEHLNAQPYKEWEALVIFKEVGAATESRLNRLIAENKQKIRLGGPEALGGALEVENILFLSAGDKVTPNALPEIARFIAGNPDGGLLYFDEDYYETADGSTNPYFKPDFPPDALLSHNYIGSSFCVSGEVVKKVGGLSGFPDDAVIHDFLFRVSEVGVCHHLPKVLVHKIARPEKAKNNEDIRVMQSALVSRGVDGTVIMAESGFPEIRIAPKGEPLISILIPTRDQTVLLRQAVSSLFELTSYPRFEVIIIDNNSTEPEFFQYCSESQDKYGSRFRVLTAAWSFNFSRLMNYGVANASGELILMLNNDVQVLDANWLSDMAGQAGLPHAGAVGVKLLYPDRTIQHAGIALGGDVATFHLFAHEQEQAPVHLNFLNYNQNLSAVTAACLMVRKEVYLEVGGMDEKLDVEYNDVDFCLKVAAAGYYNVYLHHVVLLHYESASRGHPFRNRESYRKHRANLYHFRTKWASQIDNDCYWSPNNSLLFE